MLKAVIFDMDGVLVDSEPLHYEINRLTLKEYLGIEIDYEYYKQFIGSTVFFMWKKMINDFSIVDYTEEELFAKSEVIKERLLRESGYPVIKGAVNFVKSLEGKYQLAVASSSRLINIENNMKNLGIADSFEKLVSGVGLPAPKPAPDVFLKAAEELGVNPEECIVIEDSGNGVKAAKAAGMACVGFINPSSGEQDLSMADYLFEDFHSIDYQFLEMVHSHSFGEPWRVLETDRLIIREMCPEDVDHIYSIYEGNDLRYTEKLYEDRDREREYIKDYQKYIYNFYDFGIWLFQEKSTGKVIGRGGVEHKVYEDGSEALEMGYIVKRDEQRKGYAYEGLSAILKYVKEHFEVSWVNVKTHRDNHSSIELAKKLGAVFDEEYTEEHIMGRIYL